MEKNFPSFCRLEIFISMKIQGFFGNPAFLMVSSTKSFREHRTDVTQQRWYRSVQNGSWIPSLTLLGIKIHQCQANQQCTNLHNAGWPAVRQKEILRNLKVRIFPKPEKQGAKAINWDELENHFKQILSRIMQFMRRISNSRSSAVETCKGDLLHRNCRVCSTAHTAELPQCCYSWEESDVRNCRTPNFIILT